MSEHDAVTQLDLDALQQYLSQVSAQFSGAISATKFSGGQSNPTFRLSIDNRQYVLRRQPPGKLLKSAHAVDREFYVLNALSETPVPVPKVFHLCQDPEVIGSLFYIMEYIDGTVYWDSSLPEVSSINTRRAMYQQMITVLANIHSVDLVASGLTEFGRAGNYFERQLGRWTKQYKASEITPIDEMDWLIHWLEQNMPADDGEVSLVHGDYRLDNLMFAKQEPRILAVLDWELSTLGHPIADLAYQCMQLRLPADVGHASGLGGVDRDALGIPSEQEMVDWYCQQRNLDRIEDWHFYLAFSFFRLAAIAQGVAKRAKDGNASSDKADKVGAMVPPLAKMAVQLIKEQQ